MSLSRRTFLGFLAAPAIIRVAEIMPIKPVRADFVVDTSKTVTLSYVDELMSLYDPDRPIVGPYGSSIPESRLYIVSWASEFLRKTYPLALT